MQMPEMNPPELMPQGNVGTPTKIFLDLIQRCLLPHNLIQKLQLEFPGTSGARLYSNVSLNYETNKDFSNKPEISGFDTGYKTARASSYSSFNSKKRSRMSSKVRHFLRFHNLSS